MSGRTVLLDTEELAELAELVEFTQHRVQAIDRLLVGLRPGLHLTDRWAPDAESSAELSLLLDRCDAALRPLGRTLVHDVRALEDLRRRALEADATPGRRLPVKEVTALLEGLAPTTPPAQVAVLEAVLLGGLVRPEKDDGAKPREKDRKPDRERDATRPKNRPRPRADRPGGDRDDRPGGEFDFEVS